MPEPAISVRAAHDSGSPNTPITRVVIHCTAGGQGFPKESAAGVAHSTAEYFAGEHCPGSAHYVEDVADEEHCVPDDVVAWHAPPNPGSLGVEICGDPNYSPPEWLSPQVWPAVQRAAARVRELCDRHGVPKVKLSPADLLAGKHGICGHIDVSQAWHQSQHWDPGPGFPWPQFMAEVNRTPDTSEEDEIMAAADDIIAAIRASARPNLYLLSTVSDGVWGLIPGVTYFHASPSVNDAWGKQGAFRLPIADEAHAALKNRYQ